jgi:hypothetical protein
MKLRRKKQATAPEGRERLIRDEPVMRRGQAFSYYARRSTPAGQVDTANLQRAKPPLWLRAKRFVGSRAAVFGGLAVVIALILANSLLSAAPHVAVESGLGDSVLQSDEVYQQASREILNSSVLNRSKLTINAAKISQDLEERYPEIGHATVTTSFFGHQATIHIQSATPSLILTTSEGQSYIVDEIGRLVLPADRANSAILQTLPHITDQSGLKVKPGQGVVPANTVQFIRVVEAELQAKQLAVSSLTLPANTSELDVRITGLPYIVKFNLLNDARLQSGTFLATKSQLDNEHIIPGSYIDVRVDGRAYYK